MSGQVRMRSGRRGGGGGVYKSWNVTCVEFVFADDCTRHQLLVFRHAHRRQPTHVDWQVVGLHVWLEYSGRSGRLVWAGARARQTCFCITAPACDVNTSRSSWRLVNDVEEPTTTKTRERYDEQDDDSDGDDDRPGDEQGRHDAQAWLGAGDPSLLTVVGVL